MNTPATGAKPSQPAGPAGTTAWGGPEWMGLALGLALAVFYRANFAEATTIGVVSNFLELKWATAALAAALWALLLASGGLTPRALQVTWIDAAAAALVLWALVSVSWSPDPASAGLSGLYAGIAVLLYLLARVTTAEALVRLLLVAAGVLLLGALVSHLLFGAAVDLGFGNENFASETLVLCVCILPLVWRQPPSPVRWALLAAAGLGLAYLLALAHSNLQYAAALAALWYLALHRLPRLWGAALTAALAVALAAGAVLWTSSDGFAGQFAQLPEGWRERAQVWMNVLAGIGEAPWAGHGWGSFYFSYADYIDRYLDFAPQLGLPAFDSFDRSAGAGHNEVLEVWFLLGLPGLLLTLAIIGLALVVTLRAPRGTPEAAAGLALSAWLAMAMIEFPGQNAASATLALLFLAVAAPAGPAPARLRPLNLGRPALLLAMAAALALAVPAMIQVGAQNRFAAADLLHRAGQLPASADRLGQALAASDWAPKLRLRLYPQSIVAGLPYWNQVGVPELERRYAVSRSAAPRHPVLLDLRLKFLLALTQPPAAEVETALTHLKANSGHSNANAHVLEAAWALRLGDRRRAQASLELAEARLAENPTAVSAANNRANVAALRQQLGASGPSPQHGQ